MGIRHKRSSTRHRISRPRSRYVVETTSVIFAEPAPSGSVLADPRLVFLGPDQQGELLEVMAIQTDDGGAVDHPCSADPRAIPEFSGRRVVMSKPLRAESGVEITDEIAERLADEAAAGYELTDAKRVGRRSLSGASGRSPRVNFRMTAELQARAQERAEREGKTVSEIAREALERYVS